MRDLLLLGLLPVLLFYAIKRPFIGLALWLWTSLVPMQTWAYGTATSVRWNMLFAASTMIGYVIMKNKPKVELSSAFWLITFLMVLATFSSIFHEGFGPLVWERWERFFKAYLFFVFVYLIVDKKHHYEALMWACVLSITATAAKQGLKVLLSGGGHVVYGMSSTFNDNNLSAFATLICIPITAYLIWLHKDKFILRYGMLGGIVVSILFIFGSDSRGGFLGLLVLFAFYFWESNKKLPIAFLGICVGALALSLMDASWFSRMDTIETASTDDSFMGRVIAWKLSILLAIQNPILGGGFDAVAYRNTWMPLLQYWDFVSFIPSSMPVKGHVAHSIYFQVLGDLGFLGFFVFFGAVRVAYVNYKHVRKLNTLESWQYNLAKLCMIALICFLVAGAALSVAYNEVTLMLLAISAKLLSSTKLVHEPSDAAIKKTPPVNQWR